MRNIANLHIFPTPKESGEAAADFVAHLSAEAVEARGRFTVAFSGGSLPKLLCPALVAEPKQSEIDWSKWHVFFADERCVPLTHPESNYRLILEELLSYVDIPWDQVYAVDNKLSPAQAARAYQATLQAVFQPETGDFPCFDLILLGMGEDGHTASLFPNHPLLHETKLWTAAIFDSPKPPPERITLTLPALNKARHVIFITTGAGKAEVLSQIVSSPDGLDPLPAQMVQPRGQLDWFVDEAAAAKLNPNSF